MEEEDQQVSYPERRESSMMGVPIPMAFVVVECVCVCCEGLLACTNGVVSYVDMAVLS